MKIKRVLLMALIAILMLTNFAFATEPTNIVIKTNGETMNIPEEYGKPFINTVSRTMIPLRFVSEELGYLVKFNQNAYRQWIHINASFEPHNYENYLGLEIGYSIADTAIGDIRMDAAPIIINGRTYVPMRFISETLGYDVNYDPPSISNGFNHVIDIMKDETAELLITPDPAKLVEREHDLYYLKAQIKSRIDVDLSAPDQPGSIDFLIRYDPWSDEILQQYDDIAMFLRARFGNDPIIDEMLAYMKKADGPNPKNEWPSKDWRIQKQSVTISPGHFNGNVKVWDEEGTQYFIQEGMPFEN